MIHYELMLFFHAGFKPQDLINYFGYTQSATYRFYRIYRHARKTFQESILRSATISPAKKNKPNNHDEQRAKKMRLAKRQQGKAKAYIRIGDKLYDF